MRRGGLEFGVLLGLVGGHLGELISIFTADGLHGGAFGIRGTATGFQRNDLGLNRFEVDKPALKDRLRHLFEGFG